MKNRCLLFLWQELSWFFWGITAVLLAAAVLLGYGFLYDRTITISRNPFGKGPREQALILKDQKGSQSAAITVEEMKPDERETDQIFRAFFKKLGRQMRGSNRSLSQVRHPLRFEEALKGYPFEIAYMPEDLSLIGLDGRPGAGALRLRGKETKRTLVTVTASYRKIHRSRSYRITLIAPEAKEKLSAYDKLVKELQKQEKASRRSGEFTLPKKAGEIRIELPERTRPLYGLLFWGLSLPVLLTLYRYYRLKEEEKRRKREEEADFPLIVHLISLYMKAGLSFSSAIHRISRSYCGPGGRKSGRPAFESLAFMSRQLKMGVSQKEVIGGWGKRCQSPHYRRLSMALNQVLVKGSREGERILENLEREAFEERLDRAKEEGRKKETSLLLPMVVLLCLVMVVVLFPALLRFQGF